MSDQEENVTPGEESMTAESEKDQENTSEDVSLFFIFRFSFDKSF